MFISRAPRKYEERVGIKATHSSAHHATGHAKVERANRFLQTSMRTTLAGDPEWDEEIENCAAAWNCMVHEALASRDLPIHDHVLKGTTICV